MEFNRNQFFLVGMVVLFLGVQFRLVDSFVLNDKTTHFLASKMQEASGSSPASLLPSAGPLPRKVVRPPQWLGYSLISIGSVLILHSLAMKKPGGG